MAAEAGPLVEAGAAGGAAARVPEAAVAQVGVTSAAAVGVVAAWVGETGGARASPLTPPHSPLPLPCAWQVRSGERRQRSRGGNRAQGNSSMRRCARSGGTATSNARSGGAASAAPGAVRAREEPESFQPKSARVMGR